MKLNLQFQQKTLNDALESTPSAAQGPQQRQESGTKNFFTAYIVRS